MNAILFVLRTGCQWNALDATGICSCSSAYRRFREWTGADVFLELWRRSLLAYDAVKVNDHKLLGRTLSTHAVERPEPTRERPQGSASTRATTTPRSTAGL